MGYMSYMGAEGVAAYLETRASIRHPASSIFFGCGSATLRRCVGSTAFAGVALLICLVGLVAGRLCAQPAAGQAAPPSNNRYLLIVDTSRSMAARTRGTLKAVQDLLASGMSGQMQPGDTLGVWTYNADLYAGRFPLQHWSSEGQKAITKRLLTFLRGQKYEKAADLDKVLLALERVIEDSQLITVILVSAGDGQLRGTPFDDRINEFCQRWHDQQKNARMPFVIVLRARNGKLRDYTLNTPPWSVQMPYVPVETAQVEAPAPSSAAATNATEPGKVEPPKVKLPKPSLPITEAAKAALAPAAPAKAEPAPASPTKPPEALSSPPGDAARGDVRPPGDRKAEPATLPAPPREVQPTGNAPVPPAAAAATPIQIAKSASEVVPVPKPAPAPEVKAAPAPAPMSAAATSPVQIAAAAPVKLPELVSNPPVREGERPREPKQAVGTPEVTARGDARPPAAAQTEVVTAAGSNSVHKQIWIAGVVLAGIVLGFALLLLRRSRAKAHASLITRSLDRKE
jgi:hypothetical protein